MNDPIYPNPMWVLVLYSVVFAIALIPVSVLLSCVLVLVAGAMTSVLVRS